MGVRISRP